MATEKSKKYLDLDGVQHLRDQGILVKHNTGSAVSAAAVKVGKDANGHIVIGGALTAADLGLSGALKFIGTTLTALTDGATTNPVKIKQSATDTKGVNHNATSGNVVLYNSKEFIWTGSAWEELGDESSHALKTIKVEGDGTYITGGGTLEDHRKLSHKTYTAADAAPVKIGRDTGGHVVIGGALSIDSAGAHTHPVSSDIPASTFLTSASGTTTKISLNKGSDTFVKSYPGVKSNLVTTTITGVSGSTTASYATAGTDVAVAKAGTAVTVAKRAASQTTVGNANVGTEISITGVSGSTTASKATAGTAKEVAKAGTEVTVATCADSKTTVGNANVGTELEAVAYNSATPAYTAAYDSTNECLTLTALGSTNKFYSATASTTKIYGVGDTTDIIPAVANGTITPYTFSNVTVPKAATTDTTVATGTLATDGKGGSVMTGLGTATTKAAITSASIQSGTTGDVTVVTEVKSGKNSAAVTISGTAAEKGAHTHEIK